MRLLTQSRQRIEQRIDYHQKAIATAEARGKTEEVRRHRQMTLIEEQDRRTVADLIDNLQQRFPAGHRARFPRPLGGRVSSREPALPQHFSLACFPGPGP